MFFWTVLEGCQLSIHTGTGRGTQPSLTQAPHPTAHLSLVGLQAAEKPSEVSKNKLNDSFKRHL